MSRERAQRHQSVVMKKSVRVKPSHEIHLLSYLELLCKIVFFNSIIISFVYLLNHEFIYSLNPFPITWGLNRDLLRKTSYDAKKKKRKNTTPFSTQ